MRKLFLLPIILLSSLAVRADSDTDQVAALGDSFVKAFDKADAANLAAAWAEDGEYSDIDGRTFRGREDIRKMFEGYFSSGKGRTLRVDSETLRFPAPGVAIEDGTTSVFGANGEPPSRARYTNVFVKKDGKWLLASVREAPFAAPNRSQELGSLGPLLGAWEAVAESGETIRTLVEPAAGGNFLVISRTILAKNVPISGATEWVAWDPASKAIRSWSFESDGGFSESQWKQEGGKWTVSTRGTLRDGRTISESQVLSAGDDALTVATTDFALEGKPQPAAKPLTLKRPARP